MENEEGAGTEDERTEHPQDNVQSVEIGIKSVPTPLYTPPTYYPPPPFFQGELRTLRGLRFLNWSLWLLAAYTMGLLLMLLFMLGEGMHIGFGITMGLSIGSGLLALIAFILWLTGFIFMYQGKREFGPGHSHNVSMAFMFIIVYIAITVLGFVISILFLFSSARSPDPLTDDFEYSLSAYYLLLLIFGLAANIFYSLMWMYLIIGLSTEQVRRLLWIYFAISLLVYGVTLSIFIIQGNAGLGETGTSGLGIISLLILIYCYWLTYNRVLRGDIKPGPQIPPPYYPPAWPPNYPLQSPPAYPPQYIKKEINSPPP